MLPSVDYECRAVDDAELIFTQSGTAIAKVRTVASSRKKVNENGEEKWVDDKTCWMEVKCFGKFAENVAESVTKGTLLVVRGRLQTEEWEDKESGAKRSKIVCIADDIGLSTRFAAVKTMSQRVERAAAPAAEDPWTQPQSTEEPPF